MQLVRNFIKAALALYPETVTSTIIQEADLSVLGGEKYTGDVKYTATRVFSWKGIVYDVRKDDGMPQEPARRMRKSAMMAFLAAESAKLSQIRSTGGAVISVGWDLRTHYTRFEPAKF